MASLDPIANPVHLENGAKISPSELAARFRGAATLQVLPDGELWFWPRLVPDLGSLADAAVVYHFAGGDFFYLDGGLASVPNPTGFPSVFGLPTFIDLDRALRYYADAMARHSTCRILQRVWFDQARILLVNRPEKIMRTSLAQYLRCTLRDHELIEVREEQNVDESHPVDVKISWSMSNRIALIEVKWLGYSISIDKSHVSTIYSDPRAQDGADQLARYLESNLERVPRHISRGYLVVYDARRDGVVRDTLIQDIDHETAQHYADIELTYDPRHEEDRIDFAPPARFYLAPRSPVA